MFLIKREQRQRMGDPAFVDRTVDRVKRFYLEYVYMLEDQELRFRVKHAIEKARSYGLTKESSISVFVAHMLTISPEFDKQDAIQDALHDPDLAPDNRMQAMRATVFDEDWEEATKQCDPAAYWAKIHEAKQVKGGNNG